MIRGIGYKFEYSERLFPHLKDDEKEYSFIDLLDLRQGYYSLHERGSDNQECLAIISDGMSGEYTYVLFITEASYIENSHGDSFWRHTFRNDDYIKKYAQQKIELLLNRELPEPEEVVFEHWG